MQPAAVRKYIKILMGCEGITIKVSHQPPMAQRRLHIIARLNILISTMINIILLRIHTCLTDCWRAVWKGELLVPSHIFIHTDRHMNEAI
eukprot:SAG11_NODE_1293_length_5284_cov_2.541562_3_plen_90_part_00